jgi:hypothetical protein
VVDANWHSQTPVVRDLRLKMEPDHEDDHEEEVADLPVEGPPPSDSFGARLDAAHGILAGVVNELVGLGCADDLAREAIYVHRLTGDDAYDFCKACDYREQVRAVSGDAAVAARLEAAAREGLRSADNLILSGTKRINKTLVEAPSKKKKGPTPVPPPVAKRTTPQPAAPHGDGGYLALVTAATLALQRAMDAMLALQRALQLAIPSVVPSGAPASPPSQPRAVGTMEGWPSAVASDFNRAAASRDRASAAAPAIHSKGTGSDESEQEPDEGSASEPDEASGESHEL